MEFASAETKLQIGKAARAVKANDSGSPLNSNSGERLFLQGIIGHAKIAGCVERISILTISKHFPNFPSLDLQSITE